jgi:hypothetical protein
VHPTAQQQCRLLGRFTGRHIHKRPALHILITAGNGASNRRATRGHNGRAGSASACANRVTQACLDHQRSVTRAAMLPGRRTRRGMFRQLPSRLICRGMVVNLRRLQSPTGAPILDAKPEVDTPLRCRMHSSERPARRHQTHVDPAARSARIGRMKAALPLSELDAVHHAEIPAHLRRQVLQKIEMVAVQPVRGVIQPRGDRTGRPP